MYIIITHLHKSQHDNSTNVTKTKTIFKQKIDNKETIKQEYFNKCENVTRAGVFLKKRKLRSKHSHS